MLDGTKILTDIAVINGLIMYVYIICVLLSWYRTDGPHLKCKCSTLCHLRLNPLSTGWRIILCENGAQKPARLLLAHSQRVTLKINRVVQFLPRTLPLIWDKSTMPLWHVSAPVNLLPDVSFTFRNKTILPPLCFAGEPDSVTPRQMSTTLACVPAAITYMDHVSVF